jgi:MYXO-CTERM domain-containing protein
VAYDLAGNESKSEPLDVDVDVGVGLPDFGCAATGVPATAPSPGLFALLLAFGVLRRRRA